MGYDLCPFEGEIMASGIKNRFLRKRGIVEKENLADRLNGIRERIHRACERSRRRGDEVKLLPVSKKVAPEVISEAAACGLSVFGESRVQEARQKIPLCPGRLSWHMVGHLQTNKVRDAVGLFRMIHSVDSEKLLRCIDRAVGASGMPMPVCIEVNVSGEGRKFGVDPASMPGVLKAANELMHVDVVGLMTMPPLTRDPEDARPYFRRLRELRDAWRDESGFELPELSMGMSHDFEIAIEEGATWVRLGTILFGKRPR